MEFNPLKRLSVLLVDLIREFDLSVKISSVMKKNILIQSITLSLIISCSSMDKSTRKISSDPKEPECKIERVIQRLKNKNDFLYDCKEKLYSYKYANNKIFSETKIKKTIESLSSQTKIKEKLYFIGVAFYHHTVDNYSLDEYQELSTLALRKEKELNNQKKFMDVEKSKSLFHAWIKFIDGYKTPSAHAFENLEKVLIYYKNQTELTKKDKALLLSAIMLSQRLFSNQNNLKFVSKDYLSHLNYFASKTPDETNEQYIINNGIWALRNYYYYSSQGQIESLLYNETQEYLKQRLKTSKEDSETYLWTVKSLLLDENCFKIDTEKQICKDDLNEKIYSKILKNTFSYKKEKIDVITSLSKETIDSLIKEVKLVKDNFHLITGVKNPLKEDKNEKLKMVIFSSPEDYKKYQPFLHDLPSSNGGIYIEKDATFYTYQRKKNQSRYTLEELTKHEYVHYLTGRYINHGFWGETSFYKDSNMPWFEEGIAEVLTGSHIDGLRFRNKLSKMISRDESKMSISEIIDSKYSSGFSFYRYSSALITFLNQEIADNGKSFLKNILDHFLNDDFELYKKLLVKIKQDNELNIKFKIFLKDLTTKKQFFIMNKRDVGYSGHKPKVKNESTLFKKPFVGFYYFDIIDKEKNDIIECEIVKISGLKVRNDGKCIATNSDWKVDIAVNGDVPEEEIYFKVKVKDIDGWSNISKHRFLRANSINTKGELIQLKLAPNLLDIKKETKNIFVEHFYIQDLIENNSPITHCRVISSQGLKIRQTGDCIQAKNGKWYIDIELRHSEESKTEKFFIYEVKNKHGLTKAKVEYFPI